MKLKIDFYYDTFRSGILEVPDEIEEFDYDKRHEIVLKYFADALNVNWYMLLRKPIEIIICEKLANS